MTAVTAAKVLLRSGANVNAAMKGGKTALIEAVGVGCVRLVAILLDAGASFRATVEYGRKREQHTALYLALNKNKGDIVRLLLEAGALLDDDISVVTIEDLATDFEDVQRMIRQGK